MQDWRRREVSTPALPVSSQMMAAKLAFPVPQHQQSQEQQDTLLPHKDNTPPDEQMEDFRAMRDVGRRRVSLPPPPPRQQVPSSLQVSNDVRVNDRTIDQFRHRRNMDTQVKQTRFVGNDSADVAPTMMIEPDIARTKVVGEEKQAVVTAEKKSRRKSFMVKLKKLFE